MNKRQIIILVSVLLAALCIYIIGSSVYVAQTTGLLEVSSTNNNALISISQADHNAKILGTGKAKVHLKPGAYQIVASDNGRQQFVAIQILTKQTTNIALNNLSNSMLPSTATIKFEGISSLTSRGLNNAQITALKQAFFRFEPLTQTIIVNPTSVQSTPHDPNKSVGYGLNFIVSIDSKPYMASVSYVGINDAHLILKSWPNGALVFDSGVIKSE